MNPSTLQAQVIVDELVRCGVTDAVLCAGSRNAPLSFALHAADVAGRLRLHVRIDERTAGFLALGLALRSGRPVPVCTTSGTAVANLHPAVLEASFAGVPLLVLSADRPQEMVGTGANQTIAQAGIFGTAVRLTLTGPAGGSAADNGRWRSLTDRAVAAATGALGGPPGPVQLNLPFAEPLVPDGTGAAPAGRADGGPWTSVPPIGRDAPVLPLDPSAPTLVIAGGNAPAGLHDLPVPVVAEPASAPWSTAVRTGPWLLGAPAAASLKPAQVVVAGRPTLHRAVQRLLADPSVATYVLADPNGLPWTDVAGTAQAVGSLPPLTPDPSWTHRWRTADTAAAKALDQVMDDGTAPIGLRLARSVLAGLPDGGQLLLGSSNPVRDVSLAAVPRRGLTVLTNRGVAGIDGSVSTALGAALAHDGPAYALLGDLTLLHDTTGFVIGPDEPRPDLTVVVLNDGGGGIFGLLEQGAPEHAAAFERIFGTPHRVDLAALCAATGVGHLRVDVADVAAAVVPAPGLRVVEVLADRPSLRAGHAAVRTAVDAAVAAALHDAG
ncbi:2-succinyl-5-enolpyruvyl-6-hydroxy-3-cyclohexene-1-carboxylic-acid synthase [Pseudonocardia xinjiangensis]|uniref:2-succinyl-5-enolpyruvyl-6-hydroxy-3-cyclohexene-1-carboxylate synthase n=1 Tax=Pseudonocardia xinjiangensis TaxID=75289 RepID=A0ABX1RN82_9PSEU|nr:2-succinyl-5-enolpyruvyl-6-hydroxy-3-cyclohexene-1-carboxylic-acid synthase [Pseudonocardia xinjiangensis]NMH80929.1 2-succinyl-5-enolpyruvyl-6-hydroxy-3-cyclohexene-1-carboxylic-acid synthase [Pseudonocardia xinjiangensis]